MLWGIELTMAMMLYLLAIISWILKLNQTIFRAFQIEFSGKGLILIFGGLFLIYKSTKEIYYKTKLARERIPAQAKERVFLNPSMIVKPEKKKY